MSNRVQLLVPCAAATFASIAAAQSGDYEQNSARSFIEPWEVHPMLVHYPIAFLLSAVLLDLIAWRWPHPRIAWAVRGLLLVGVGSGFLAALAGLLAFMTIPSHTEEAHTLMFWHMGVQAFALALFGCLAWLSWHRSPEPLNLGSRALGWGAALVLAIGSGIGGYIVYHGGAGIDPTLLAAEIREGHTHGGGQTQHEKHEHAAKTDAMKNGDAHQHPTQEPGKHKHGDKKDAKKNGVPAAQKHDEYDVQKSASVPPKTRAPEQMPTIPPPDAASAQVPAGYRVEIVLKDLTYPTCIAIDDAGVLYVAEGGYIYGDDAAPARIIRVRTDGKKETAADQLNGPITDLLWHDNRLYISHRGKISVLEGSKVRDLVTGLPSLGDHHNNQLAVGPDGKIYFGQGTATNSGVVGLDNFKMGWLAKYPDVQDLPPKDIRVTKQAFATPDILTLLAGKTGHDGHDAKMSDQKKADHADHGAKPDPKNGPTDKTPAKHEHDDAKKAVDTPPKKAKEQAKAKDHEGHDKKAKDDAKGHQGHDPKKEMDTGKSKPHDMAMSTKTYPFQAFGKTPPDDGALRGVLKANGTILRMNPDGSDLEVYAWGLRNPYGLRWGPDGKLYASDNGYDERGSRPIAHAPDFVWVIKQGAWYGFPDYVGGIPVTDARFKPANGPAPKFLMRDHPDAERPLLSLTHHAGAAQMDFSRDARFGFKGHMFLALVGDMNPITGHHDERSGFMVVRIDPAKPKAEPFFHAKKAALGPKELDYIVTTGPKRPVGVRFTPSGDALYVVDIGALAIFSTATGPAPRPFPRTGVVWRITRDEQAGQ